MTPRRAAGTTRGPSTTPVDPAVAPRNFWTPTSKRGFHSAANALKNKTDVPDGDSQGYRNRPHEDDDRYVLRDEEELQLTDHIAFLFSTEERCETVTAATVEEHDGGRKLVVRVASNETPKPDVVSEFREVMETVSSYARKGWYPART